MFTFKLCCVRLKISRPYLALFERTGVCYDYPVHIDRNLSEPSRVPMKVTSLKERKYPSFLKRTIYLKRAGPFSLLEN